MNPPILITGGTGPLGRELVSAATGVGHAVRVMSRSVAPLGVTTEWASADLRSGEGVEAALAGIQTIVHAASDPRDSAVVDARGTQRLVAAARRAGARHLVYVSILGVDRIPLPYYRDKLAAEAAIRASGLGWTILRCAQFHSFIDFLLGRAARCPMLLPVPIGVRVQSIDTREAARRSLALALDEPTGSIVGLAGPTAMSVRAAARAWVSARGEVRALVPVPLLGSLGAALRGGHNTLPDRPGGGDTWGQWLARRYGLSPVAEGGRGPERA